MVEDSKGYHTESFPAPGLRQIFRHITGQNDEGQSVFLHSDHGDHYRLMVEKQAVANILYSTRETPVDLNDNVDVKKAKAEEVGRVYDSRGFPELTRGRIHSLRFTSRVDL